MTPLLDPAGPGAAEDWLRHARSDLRVARLAHQDPDILACQPAFHAQQAVEKVVQGKRLFRPAPGAHDVANEQFGATGLRKTLERLVKPIADQRWELLCHSTFTIRTSHFPPFATRNSQFNIPRPHDPV